MKKYTSAASLALRLTWCNVLTVFVIVGLCQWFLVYRTGFENEVFDYLLDETAAPLGIMGQLVLVGAMYFALSGQKGSKTAYTLRRLQLSEGSVTAVFALMFTGYFVLYWAFQIGMVLWLYTMYVGVMDAGQNLLFVSAFRSKYFHSLLPLYEPWAVVRNAVFCLCFGSFGALGAQNARNGRSAPLLLFFVVLIWWVILYPHEMASRTNDISMTVISIICLGIDSFWTWRWMQNEAN